MNIRTVAIKKDHDLRRYLLDAEKTVDALTDDELDLFEEELETKLLALVNPKPSLRLIASEPTAPKAKNRTKTHVLPAFTGLLIAALALLVLQTPDPTPNFQTKGQSDAQLTPCSVLIQQPGFGSSEATDNGYIVKPSAAVYLKTSCGGELTLEVERSGAWTKYADVKTEEGYLSSRGTLFDLRTLIGEKLRIRSEEGLSEEFILVEGR